jgi:hypothetical protein
MSTATPTDYVSPNVSYPGQDARFYTLKGNGFFAHLMARDSEDDMPTEFMNARNFYMEAIRCDRTAFIPNANLILLYLHQGFLLEATQALSEASLLISDSEWLLFVNSCLKYDANLADVEKFAQKFPDFTEEIKEASVLCELEHCEKESAWKSLVRRNIGKEEGESLWSMKRVVNAGKNYSVN